MRKRYEEGELGSNIIALIIILYAAGFLAIFISGIADAIEK